MSEYVARNGEHALFLTYIALGEKNYQTFMKTTIGTLPYAVIFYLL
jgi:hypothetical protein